MGSQRQTAIPYCCNRGLMQVLRLCLAVPLYVTALFAQVWPSLDDISSLRCSFEARITSERWEPGSEPKLDLGKVSEPFQLVVDSIDRENDTARMIGNVGSADLVVVPSPRVLHLIERTPSGGLNLLTIDKQLSDDGPRSSFRAVYSRHGPPIFEHWIVAQYYGTCRMWE